MVKETRDKRAVGSTSEGNNYRKQGKKGHSLRIVRKKKGRLFNEKDDTEDKTNKLSRDGEGGT